MKRTLLVLICAGLFLAACGEEENGGLTGVSDPGSGGDEPVTSAPQTPGDGEIPSPNPSIVEPQPGQEDVRPIGWNSADKGMDDQTLTINYISGVEPCYVLDHIDVEYSDEKVTVTLFEGHSPSDEEQACIELAVYKAVVVELDEPLDGRKVVDGAPK